MIVGKPNLVAMLLEVGEENAAVLLAQSDLPDEIDLEASLRELRAFGLDRDQLDEVTRLTVGAVEPGDDGVRRRRGEMETTISRRWSDLVDQWLSRRRRVTKPQLPQGFDFTDPDVYATRVPTEVIRWATPITA